MLNQTHIKTLLETDFKNRFRTIMSTKLLAKGWSSDMINAVDAPLTVLSHGTIRNNTDNLSVPQIMRLASKRVEYKMDAVTKSITRTVNSKIRTGITSVVSAKKMAKAKAKLKAHDVFNSKKSLSIPEPVFSEPNVTSPVNIQDANYTVREDYPHTYGFIDSVKNWMKINKKKNHAEIVHNSGTHIKIDEKGNVTMHIVGSLKQIIEKDYSLEVRGNFDHIVGGNKYNHISGNVEDLIDGNHNTNIGGTRQENASMIGHN